jgi:hypothetical protein
MKKFILGIMSNEYEVEAINVDIAVCAVAIKTQTMAPIAIYLPDEKSVFSLGMMMNSKELDIFDKFIGENIEEIKKSLKTFKKL